MAKLQSNKGAPMVGRGSDTNLSCLICDPLREELEGPTEIEPLIKTLLQCGYHYIVPLHNRWHMNTSEKHNYNSMEQERIRESRKDFGPRQSINQRIKFNYLSKAPMMIRKTKFYAG